MHQPNQFQRAVIDIQLSDNGLRMAHGYIDETGHCEHGVSVVEIDGVQRTAANGYRDDCVVARTDCV